jgi:hypothetical protein
MIDRRQWLGWTAAGAAAALSSRPFLGKEWVSNRIAEENRLPGTQDWMLRKTEIDPATRYRSPAVEGFASKPSYQAGETVAFHVSTRSDDVVELQVFRMGFYGGAGARRMATLEALPTQSQKTPVPGPRRLMRCEWPVTAQWRIPDDALSGVYLAKLTSRETEVESYIVFIVRDERSADFVFQCSDFTWQAYNRWPSQFSLYDDGQHEWYWGGESQVGFQRPYGKYCQIFDAPLSIGSGEFLLWEFPFAYWLESLGLDVTYISNLDTHRGSETLTRGRGVLSVGHDEYWTIEMFRNMQSAIAAGTSLGFFSGNTACGRVLWDEETMSLRRVGVFGPPEGTAEFQSMSSLEHVPPYANELLGAHSTGPVTGGADWACSMPDHWIFEGTGMKLGDAIPGLVGWEWHGDPAPIPGLEIVSTGPTQSAPGKPNGGQYTATVYPGPRGNIVFNASTIWWGDGLSAPPGYVRPAVYTTPQGPDVRVQRITLNVLAKMVGRPLSGANSAIHP